MTAESPAPGKRRVSLLVAVAENGVIGRGGGLPWHLPADLARFKRLTMGHTLLMGRRTHDSIGRLLPGRTTVILTRQTEFAVPGALVCNRVEDALAAGEGELFIVGGAEIYRAAWPLANRLLLTLVHGEVTGDTRLSPIDFSQWRLTYDDWHAADARHAWPLSFREYERIAE